MDERMKKECKWVRKPDLSLQLQTNLWWVGSVIDSDLRKGLIYWKVATCPKSLSGYSENEKEAVETVEALIKACRKYAYNLVDSISELSSVEQLRKEQE